MTSEPRSDAPALTVITATFNRLPYLREALASVREQGRTDVEHLVIDGGSTDGTLEWLASQDGDPALTSFSEPDEGVYDAWNKALRLARGHAIGFLNSDDRFAPGALDAVVDHLERHPRADLVSGGAAFFTDHFEAAPTRVVDDLTSKSLSLRNTMTGNPIINARFFRASVFHQLGDFDPSFQAISDKEFLIRAWRHGLVSVPVDRVLYHYRQHDSSLTLATTGMTLQRQSEALVLSHRYMTGDPPRALQTEAGRWHALRTGAMAWSHLGDRELRGALHWVRRGWGADPRWPVRFVRAARQLRRDGA
jgi:GT2 family glycosyltransferase